MGVRLLLGTDAGSMGVKHGVAVFDEIDRFLEAGLPLAAVLRAATSAAAAPLRRSAPAAGGGCGFRGRATGGITLRRCAGAAPAAANLGALDARPRNRRATEGTPMYTVRLWSVRHARGLRRLYVFFSRLAPALAPLVRWLGSRRAEALLQPIERAAKGFMFDCRECGQCVLSATGMACPMNCPKQMRNGPCGGVRDDGTCEVDPQMRCVWVEATEGTKRIAADHLAHPTPLLAAIDARNAGRSTWIRVIEGHPEPAFQPPVGERRTAESRLGPFERACRSGEFVVTVELGPPDSADPQALLERAARFQRPGRRHQRHRWRGRQLPHVERGGLGHSGRPRLSRRSTRSPAATATASPSRATSSAPPRWACRTSCA